MNVKSALDHLVSAGRKANKLNECMRELGYDNTPYADLYGEIADSIFLLVEDSDVDFQDSQTNRFLNSELFSDSRCSEELNFVYKQNNDCILDLSEGTLEMIHEVAVSKGISVHAMLKVIISEWSIRQHFIRTLRAV